MEHKKYPYLDLYLRYVALSVFVVGLFFSLQVIIFIKDFKPQWVIMPLLVGILAGLLLATTLKLHKQLQTRNRLFHALADFGQEFLYICNLQGKYEYVSPYCQNLTGYNPAEFYAQPHLLARLVHPDDRDLLQDYIANLDYSKQDPPALDLHIITKSGEIKTISHMSSGVFDEQGHLLAVRSSNIDITRREEIERLKTQVISKMSHEFRTPMNGILGCASLLEEEIEDKELAKYLGMIRQSGERLMDTLDNVLELSYLEHHPCPKPKYPLNLCQATYDALAPFQIRVQEKGLILRIDLDNCLANVAIQTQTYERILKNLFSNALKFCSSGEIRIRLFRLEEAQAPWVCLQVSDQGIGIQPDFLPYVFEEFRQESDGSTRRYDGSGIGLAIAKRLAECAGGRIEVRSQPQQGSTFSLYLPLAV